MIKIFGFISLIVLSLEVLNQINKLNKSKKDENIDRVVYTLAVFVSHLLLIIRGI